MTKPDISPLPEFIYTPCKAEEYNRSDKGTYSVTMLGSNGEQKFGYLKESLNPEKRLEAENKALREHQDVEKLAEKFKVETMPNADTPFHHQAEGWYCIQEFVKWLKQQPLPPPPKEQDI
jgi:hypothetical protein